MSRNTSRKILVSFDKNIYKFLTYHLEDADGSFYISIQRERLQKISYHSSGCVRYHNTDFSSAYFEPLASLTRVNPIASFIVPAFSSLDLFNGNVTEDDFVLELKSNNEPIQFNFLIAPWNDQIDSNHIAIRYEQLFAFLLEISPPTIIIPEEAKGYFTFAVPQKGFFEQQAIDKDSALILFHQSLQGIRDLILYSPNNDGIYKIICAVPMFAPPHVEIEFLDSKYSTEIINVSKSVVKFKVKNQHGHTMKQEVAIANISLSSHIP